MSDLAERFAAQGTRLAELQARIAALHGRLAQGPDEGVEADLASLMRERDSRLHTWALLALAWQAGGGQVQLHGQRGSRDWRVGIQHPRQQGQNSYFAALEATDASISSEPAIV